MVGSQPLNDHYFSRYRRRFMPHFQPTRRLLRTGTAGVGARSKPQRMSAKDHWHSYVTSAALARRPHRHHRPFRLQSRCLRAQQSLRRPPLVSWQIGCSKRNGAPM